MSQERPCKQVKVSDIKIGDEFLNSDFRCWETVVTHICREDGMIEMGGGVDYAIYGPNDTLSVRVKE